MTLAALSPYLDPDLDRAYADGKEDLARKLIEYAEELGYDLTPDHLIDFLEAELGAVLTTPDDPVPD